MSPRLTLEATVWPVANGYMARADALPLAGKGANEACALWSLETVVAAWCNSLFRIGRLKDALRCRGVEVWWDDDEPVEVDVVLALDRKEPEK